MRYFDSIFWNSKEFSLRSLLQLFQKETFVSVNLFVRLLSLRKGYMVLTNHGESLDASG
jgi:hypothetical protein